eukprot:1355119-Pleurochrysis_carterae.AAC.2
MSTTAETAQTTMEAVSWEYRGRDPSLPKYFQSSTQFAHVGDLLMDDCLPIANQLARIPCCHRLSSRASGSIDNLNSDAMLCCFRRLNKHTSTS